MSDTKGAEESQPIVRDPFSHRAQKMMCLTCMWFVGKEPEDANNPVVVGRCRRHSPTMAVYPLVFDGDWCDLHKIDENRM